MRTARRFSSSRCPITTRESTTSPTTELASCATRDLTGGCASLLATWTRRSRPTTCPRTRSTRLKSSAGQIVDIEIDLLPIGVAFHPGEHLRFIVSAGNLLGTLMPAIDEYVGANSGQHVIHTGGEHASYLQLPLQKQ